MRTWLEKPSGGWGVEGTTFRDCPLYPFPTAGKCLRIPRSEDRKSYCRPLSLHSCSAQQNCFHNY